MPPSNSSGRFFSSVRTSLMVVVLLFLQKHLAFSLMQNGRPVKGFLPRPLAGTPFLCYPMHTLWNEGGMCHAPCRHTRHRNAAAAPASPAAGGCAADVRQLGQRPGGDPLSALGAPQKPRRNPGAAGRVGTALPQPGLLPVGHGGKGHRTGVRLHQPVQFPAGGASAKD